MRSFIIKARHASTRWERIRSQIGAKGQIEVIAHSVINAFFISSGFRTDVEVYIVLDSSEDFPRTIHLSGSEGLSLAGFHEEAVISLIENTLKSAAGLQKDQSLNIAPGVKIYGFGFERLISKIESSNIYLLDKKGENLRETKLGQDPIFILTDHLAMPKNTIKGLKRKGIKTLSLGKKLLFASQCVVILNHEIDLTEQN